MRSRKNNGTRKKDRDKASMETRTSMKDGTGKGMEAGTRM